MKKLTFLLIALFALATSNSIFAQKKGKAFQGTIKYDITYPGMELDEEQKAQMSTEMTMTIGDGKFKEASGTEFMSSTTIFDLKNTSTILLFDLVGQFKRAIKTGKEKIDSASKDAPAPKIEKTTETKVILGYTCTKYILTFEDELVITTFVTEDILGDYNNWGGDLKGINGTALESEMTAEGQTQKYTAREIKAEKIKNTEFMIPEDFKIIPAENLKAEMQEFMESMRGQE